MHPQYTEEEYNKSLASIVQKYENNRKNFNDFKNLQSLYNFGKYKVMNGALLWNKTSGASVSVPLIK